MSFLLRYISAEIPSHNHYLVPASFGSIPESHKSTLRQAFLHEPLPTIPSELCHTTLLTVT
jgi:hypothetical protein